MTSRTVGREREILLGQAALFAPTPEQGAEGCSLSPHDARLAFSSDVRHDLRGHVPAP